MQIGRYDSQNYKLNSISNTLLGGDVTTILLRQAILTRTRKSTQLPRGEAGRNPQRYLCESIPITVVTQEAYSYDADITNHAVETGTNLQDHVVLNPIKVDISFEISNFESRFSNSFDAENDTVVATENLYPTAKEMFDKLDILWKERRPITLQTTHRQLKNMVLRSFHPVNRVPEWGALIVRASFQQVSFVTLQSVERPLEKVIQSDKTSGVDNQKSIESAINGGNSKAVDLNFKDYMSFFSDTFQTGYSELKTFFGLNSSATGQKIGDSSIYQMLSSH